MLTGVLVTSLVKASLVELELMLVLIDTLEEELEVVMGMLNKLNQKLEIKLILKMEELSITV